MFVRGYMKSTPKILYALFALCMVCFLTACAPPPAEPTVTPTPPPTSTPAPSPTPTPSLGPFIAVGEPVVRNKGTSTEVVRNCVSGAVDSIVKTPQGSVGTGYNVEWSVSGQSGFGGRIGGGVLPVEVNLEASLAATYGSGYEESSQMGTGWQLPAQPGQIVTYILRWDEVWQPGYVEVRLGSQPIAKVDVAYRTAIQSEIIAEDAQGCHPTPAPPPATPVVTKGEYPFDWVYDQIRLLEDVTLIWTPCPDESVDSCARWSVADNDEKSVALQVLNCRQDGSWVDLSGNGQIGLEVGTYSEVTGITVRRRCPTAIPTALPLTICGEASFSPGSFATSSPTFVRPEGYTSGWITADPSSVILPDGSIEAIPIRYVLIIDNLAQIQLQEVPLGKIYGCWLRSDATGAILDDAYLQLEAMKRDAPNAVSGIFSVSAAGLVEIARR